MTEENPSNYFVHTLLRARDWQPRPQFEEVCRWWHDGGRGVCALVGMGGAGKTAVAERFLRILPGGLPDDPDVPKDPTLPSPQSTFVYSFYDEPNPESFFNALQMWLQHMVQVQTVLSIGQMLYLLQQNPGLVVLDGLERVQEDGSRGIFGRLVSPKLRDFLDRVAAGYLPNLSVLVTSRFPLADLRDARPQFFHLIPVEQIDLPTGIALLRARGVHGTDVQLEPIVEHCGRHALTVDFAGGFITEYGNSDPATPLRLGTAEEIAAEAEQEPDEERRAVLKQGRRFARIAERYREAMIKSDEAALALLERICLFRLGVDCETLVAIFTGANAEKVSGKALASLNADQLQKKLDWLVRMRIVEKAERKDEVRRMKDEKGDSSFRLHPLSFSYSIHPAVRDGFLSGISRDAAQASHEAVRKGLEVSLGSAPGENPSDPATLDLLEEIVHHTLQSGHVPEAWDIYQNRMGGGQNLLWRLGAYERGERICRAFADGLSPETIRPLALEGAGQAEGGTGTPGREDEDGILTDSATKHDLPYESLPKDKQAIFINEWALYLKELGRLAAVARCFELDTELAMREENWKHAAIYDQNLCDVWLLIGRLRVKGEGGRIKGEQDQLINPSAFTLHPFEEALRLAELADDEEGRRRSYARHAHALARRGDIPDALANFLTALNSQHKLSGNDQPLWADIGVHHTRLLSRLGRWKEATRLTKANQEICVTRFGPDFMDISNCELTLSMLDIERGELSSAESLCASSRSWAEPRDAKEVLCWSALVLARIELKRIELKRMKDEGGRMNEVALGKAETAIAEGMKIARDCGFGLYHIDILLERTSLHLMRGNPNAALADIKLALDTGIPANDKTGQPELLAAKHEECGYAWAIPAGLQLRAEALLLQAAQEVDSDSFVPAKQDKLPEDVNSLIDKARMNLDEAMDRWQPLHDPEPEHPDQNFKLNGKVYNCRAAETWQILQDLDGGVLTNHPLKREPEVEPTPDPSEGPPIMANRLHIALSFPGEHRDFVLKVAETLAVKLTRDRIFYDEWYEVELLGEGGDLKLQAMYEQADLVIPFFSKYYDKPWCAMEWTTIRGILLNRRKDDAVIPVHMDDTDVPGWPPVNFGIRLRGRTPQKIADLILQALAMRIPAVAATTAPGATPPISPTPTPSQPPIAAAPSASPSPPSSGALAIWQEKLDYLQQQEAITADPAQKFALKKQIEEAEEKIRELGG